MDRKQLANQCYVYMKHDMFEKTAEEIWRAIAETDDNTLLEFYQERVEKDERTGGSL